LVNYIVWCHSKIENTNSYKIDHFDYSCDKFVKFDFLTYGQSAVFLNCQGKQVEYWLWCVCNVYKEA
jgi:hypothetical protein